MDADADANVFWFKFSEFGQAVSGWVSVSKISYRKLNQSIELRSAILTLLLRLDTVY